MKVQEESSVGRKCRERNQGIPFACLTSTSTEEFTKVHADFSDERQQSDTWKICKSFH
jgi:hypothetical protein